MKEVIGQTQTDRRGLGSTTAKWWSKTKGKEKRNMIIDEIRSKENSTRVQKAVQQPQQGQWTNWDTAIQRSLTWNVIWHVAPLRISYLIRSVYDLLPSNANLVRWGNKDDPKCPLCQGSSKSIVVSDVYDMYQLMFMMFRELIAYVRENFEKKYADEIAKGTYDERDLKRLQEDNKFASSYIRGKDRLDEGVDLVHTSLKFRKEVGVNDLTEDYFELDLWNLGAMYFKNRDIEGKRIFWLKVRLHMKNANAERLAKEKKAIIFGLEKAFNEAPLQQIVVLLDMTSCGLANLDMDFVKYIITIFKFYYPTFLGYMLIYDMPWIFNAAWKVVKAWLSAEAAAKIKFVSKGDIQTYIKADALPEYMGGTDIFEYRYERGMASLPLYPEDEDKKKEKKVHFQEAQEPTANSDSVDTSSSDHNGNNNSSNGLRKRSPGGHHSQGNQLNKNNNANEKLSLVLGRPKNSSGLSTFVGRLLTVSPADELTFQSSPGGDAFDIITLSNTLTHAVAFKVKTTSPEKFRVRPSSGIINPRKTEEVYVYLVQDHKTDVSKDKFLIMAMEVKPGASFDPNQLFKEASKDKIMQHKLMCSEEGQRREQVDAVPSVQFSNENFMAKVEQLEQQTLHMQRQLNLLLIIQILTAVTLILVMLAYSCVGEEFFTKFLALPFDFCNDPYGRKC
ncbi:motile sperm domain-containing protein 2-like [Plakobranchus ocellatus]|uniref:Motile sperm domain-containing protein 2-like n=1 Tax=Plakobranchus ocellatus TaxID=259542 RepID=A0AAV3YH31_9GAST|nr:motile sperm domain-containing protein 2-like [Plakobranchus ocellatus]